MQLIKHTKLGLRVFLSKKMQSDLTLYYFIDAFSYVTLALMVSSYLGKNPGLIYEQCSAWKGRGWWQQVLSVPGIQGATGCSGSCDVGSPSALQASQIYRLAYIWRCICLHACVLGADSRYGHEICAVLLTGDGEEKGSKRNKCAIISINFPVVLLLSYRYCRRWWI